MKKNIRFLACVLILMTFMTVASSAVSENTASYTYETDGTEYTVIFSDNSIPTEKQEAIAQKLIGIEGSSAQTYGLGCTLFGHDYLYDTVDVITHKAKTYTPRCKQDTYDVTYCEDCDYCEQTLVAETYIHCCSED